MARRIMNDQKEQAQHGTDIPGSEWAYLRNPTLLAWGFRKAQKSGALGYIDWREAVAAAIGTSNIAFFRVGRTYYRVLEYNLNGWEADHSPYIFRFERYVPTTAYGRDKPPQLVTLPVGIKTAPPHPNPIPDKPQPTLTKPPVFTVTKHGWHYAFYNTSGSRVVNRGEVIHTGGIGYYRYEGTDYATAFELVKAIRRAIRVKGSEQTRYRVCEDGSVVHQDEFEAMVEDRNWQEYKLPDELVDHIQAEGRGEA